MVFAKLSLHEPFRTDLTYATQKILRPPFSIRGPVQRTSSGREIGGTGKEEGNQGIQKGHFPAEILVLRVWRSLCAVFLLGFWPSAPAS